MSGALIVSEFTIKVNLIISNSGVGRVMKKVKCRPNLSVDTDDPTVDGCGWEGQKAMEDTVPKISYMSKLMVQEGDVKTEVVDVIPSITFSDRVQKFIERKMTKTVVVKLLGRKITFNALLNRVIFGQYLIVRPWLPNFSTVEDEVESRIVWVRLPVLLEGYYSNFILKEIGQVIKTDDMENARRGRFARMVLCVDPRKPLLSKIKINGRTQRI
ncbi:hypothetical protein J1N35_021888 [Gossypium stocksii]|uniref:DUF4283 domain-containing protein n=1 Tax=Gossypium stocksii TaxID=47602 RepID=A0A9D3VGK4_9ROSI|nr:hypothetical protein J1N35_021888 [Gossypium stocksii]